MAASATTIRLGPLVAVAVAVFVAVWSPNLLFSFLAVYLFLGVRT